MDSSLSSPWGQLLRGWEATDGAQGRNANRQGCDTKRLAASQA